MYSPLQSGSRVASKASKAIYFAGRRRYRAVPSSTAATATPEARHILDSLSHQTSQPLNLRTLLSFGDPLTPSSVLSSVHYVLDEVPRRLAARIRMLEALPFIVCSNPYIASTLHAHKDSLHQLVTCKKPTTIKENEHFAGILEELVARHVDDVPTMSKGFQECSRYISSHDIGDFLDRAIRNRISVRLIAEQHCAISHMLNHPESRNISVVDMHCSPKMMVEKCAQFVTQLCESTLGSSPSVVIDGQHDATFAAVPIHLEYILNEVLKNAFRATVENHHKQHGPQSSQIPIPPVTVTLAPPFAHDTLQTQAYPRFFSIRVRDQGGGVSLSNMARIFSYAFTTAGKDTSSDPDLEGGPYAAQHVGGMAAINSGGSGGGHLFAEITRRGLQTGLGTLSGLGYGLPMSKLYASFFGGSLELFTLEGWGSDVLIKMRCLEEMGDATI